MAETSIIGNRIWKHRTLYGLKQEDLAFLIGQKNGSQISRYEKGQMIPKLAQLMKLCYALGVELESLYPELMRKWKQEVEERREELKNNTYGLQETAS